MEVYPVPVFSKPIESMLALPGSKSITNRALILAALAQGKTVLNNVLWSEDTECMMDCLSKLGYSLIQDINRSTVTIIGQSGKVPNSEAIFDVKNAGTVARFLPALCGLNPNGAYVFQTSNPAMKSRPMQGLITALQSMGAQFTFFEKTHCFPFVMKTSGLRATASPVDAEQSSQILTALLLVLPYIQGEKKLYFKEKLVSKSMIHMTLKMMKEWKIEVIKQDHFFEIASHSLASYLHSSLPYEIEPDATAATYFGSLVAVCGGKLILKQLSQSSLQPDLRYFDILKDLHLLTSHYTLEGLFIKSTGIHSQTMSQASSRVDKEYDFNDISDTFMSLAAISPLLNYKIQFNNILHTRHKETDRIHAMATELKKLGPLVEETSDSLTITPPTSKLSSCIQAPPSISTYEDHRIAMSFAILGSYNLLNNGQPWLFLENPECCKKTFPNFFQILNSLRIE